MPRRKQRKHRQFRIAIIGGICALALSMGIVTWVFIHQRSAGRQLQSESPENERSQFLMNYFLPLFQIEPDQVSHVEALETKDKTPYFLPGSKQFVRGLKLLPLVIGNKYHPAGLSCELYALSPEGPRQIEVQIHRCVAGIRLAEFHEDDKHHSVSRAQKPPVVEGAGGWLATVKVIGLGARGQVSSQGKLENLTVLDEDMTVFLKIERIEDHKVFTTEDVHTAMENTARTLSRENMDSLSIESKLITAVLNTSFIRQYYFEFKDMVMGMVRQNIFASLSGPVGVGGHGIVPNEKYVQARVPESEQTPDVAGAGLPASIAQSFGYGSQSSTPQATSVPASLQTELWAHLKSKSPSLEERRRWIELGRTQPQEVFDHFFNIVTQQAEPAVIQELITLLLEINTENSRKLLSYLLGGVNDLGFRQLNSKLTQRVLDGLVALSDLAEPAADMLVQAWLDTRRPREIRDAIQAQFSHLDFHGQRVVASRVAQHVKTSVSAFEKVAGIEVIAQLPFNRDHVALIKPFLTDSNPVVQRAAIRAVGNYGDTGFQLLKDVWVQRTPLPAEIREEILKALIQTGPRGARLVSLIRISSPENILIADGAIHEHIEVLRKRFRDAQSVMAKEAILYEAAKISATSFVVDVVKMPDENMDVRRRAFVIFNYPDYFEFNDEWDASRVWHYLSILDLNVPFFNEGVKGVLMSSEQLAVKREQDHMPEHRYAHYKRMWQIAREDFIQKLAGNNQYLREVARSRLAILGVPWVALVDEILLTDSPALCRVQPRMKNLNEELSHEWRYVFAYLQRLGDSDNGAHLGAVRGYLPILQAIHACRIDRGVQWALKGRGGIELPDPDEVIARIETVLRSKGLL